MINTLKRKLFLGQPAIGPFLTLNCPDLVEIMGLTGFDFLIIDTEHGPMEAESIQHLIRAAELRGITPIVRVSDTRDVTILKTLDVGAHGIQVPQVNSPQAAEAVVRAAELRGITPIVRVSDTRDVTILKTLDVGAHGIQVPQVNSPQAAEAVVRAAKYHPLGTRGAALPRASEYGLRPLDEHLATANEETMVIVHCENRTGLACVEEIAATPGVDVLFVGPYDLSQSLGVPGQLREPVVVEAVDRALKAANAAGKPAGIFVTSEEEGCMRLDQGFKYIAYSVDGLVFANACTHVVKTLKKHMGCPNLSE